MFNFGLLGSWYHCNQRAIEIVANEVPSGIKRITFLTGFTFSFSTALAGMMIIASKSRKANVFFMCFNLIMYNKFFY